MTEPVTLGGISPSLGASSTQPAAREWGFMETLRGAMNEAQQTQSGADAKVKSLLSGDGMDVHSAMIAVEKADLSFELMMQVRNKIVAAYQEVSRMQF
jgi:flagellar hook-basal body complex protein FliE